MNDTLQAQSARGPGRPSTRTEERQDRPSLTKPDQKTEREPVFQQAVLSAPQREGYVRRFVNDVPGRIDRFKKGGYTPVEDDGSMKTSDGSYMASTPLGSFVTRNRKSGGTSVLMEIKKE